MKKLILMFVCVSLVLSLAPSVYAGVSEEGIWGLSNLESGKFMNVYAGIDKDGVRVVVWDQDGSPEQNFKFVHVGENKFLIYPQSSNSRVIDINRGNSYKNPLRAGLRVDIWRTNDSKAQEFYINHYGDGNYTIELAALPGYVLQANEPWKNDGSITLEKYDGSEKQLWKLIRLDKQDSTEDKEFLPQWPTPNGFNVTVLSYYYGNASKGGHPNKGGGNTLGAMDIGGNGDVVAVETGTVTKVVKGYGGGWGNNITIKHDNGQYSFYAHLKDNSITVSENSRVEKGQKIGIIGNTGNSFGNHLHFEIWDNNGDTTETWVYFRESYKAQIKYDADIVSGGSNPSVWRTWILDNCILKNGLYVSK